ncbi:MAG: cytochrome C [Pirellulaceae bacterium]|nr:cytochrome C [Pirellulaceae bacterium]
MSSKSIIAILIAVSFAVAYYVATRGDRQEDIAKELAKKQIQRRMQTIDQDGSDQSTGAIDLDVMRLTEALYAQKQDNSGRWLVKGQDSPGTVMLPFVPPLNGTLPDDGDIRDPDSSDANPGFVGASECAECHRDRHAGFIHTAHHRTSGVVQVGDLDGRFMPPGNQLRTPDPELSFTMLEQDEQYVQRVSYGQWHLDFPLQVFTGSAKTGRTFLYWHGDALYQSHVSYLSGLDEWIPSPGYDARQVDYARPIRSGCLECHLTFIEPKRGTNRFDPQSAVYGISCERCHGPGEQHVTFHRANPDEKVAKAIIHPSDLSRESQLDICGQCHSGSFSLLGKPFAYRPGFELSNYHKLKNPDFKGVGGIHTSNQLTRLGMSACFQNSEMTCTTCHNPHENQRGNRQAFTESCLACHETIDCGLSDELGERIVQGCIECHMPMGDNEGMTLQVAEGSFTVTMIDHYIRVDKRAAQEHLQKSSNAVAE